MGNLPGRQEIKRDLITFAGLHVLLFSVFTIIAQFFYYGTGVLELWMARQMLGGRIPYHNFSIEYPPLALLFFLLPGLLFQTTTAYSWAFAVELLVCDVLAMFFIADMASLMKVSVRQSLVVYSLLILAIGPIVVCRYDILPAMLVLAALWAFVRGRTGLAWAAAGLGIVAKIYPALVVPLFIICQVRNRQYRQLIKDGAIFLAVMLVSTVPWLVIDAAGFWHSLSYHLERGLHIESTYGTALMVGRLLGMSGINIVFNYGSWNIAAPLADRLAGISFFVSAASLVIVYVLFAWRLRKDREGNPVAGLLQYGTLAVATFILTNKVFSVQYLIWLGTLLPLITARRQYLVPGLFIIAAVLTQYVYPYNYTGFVGGETWPVLMMAVRNLLLVAVAVLIALPHRGETAAYHIRGTSALRSGG
jgi:uncharacterized membrane protein